MDEAASCCEAHHREGNEARLGAENFIRNVIGGKILVRKNGGSHVIDIGVNVNANEAELSTGWAYNSARIADKDWRPQSEVKQVRFAIGSLEDGAAELGSGGVS